MSNVDQLLNVGSTCNKVPFLFFFSQKTNCFICIIVLFIFQAIAALWVLSVVGSWCNFVTLFYIGNYIGSSVQA